MHTHTCARTHTHTQLHDHKKAQSRSSVSPTLPLRGSTATGLTKPVTLYSSQASIEEVWSVPGSEFEPPNPQEGLVQPLLSPSQEQLQQEGERRDSLPSLAATPPFKQELTVVEIHDSEEK